MSVTRWYERHAWIVFALIGLMGLSISLLVLLDPDPGAGARVFAQLDGVVLPDAIAADPAALAYVEFVSRFAFTATFGVDLMTVLVAFYGFRRGARWAWVALCYWPALYLHNLLTYDASARPVQLAMLVITAAALAAAFRTTWRRPATSDAQRAAA